MTVKIKPHLPRGRWSAFWLLYFIFSIAGVGAIGAYMICVPLYAFGRFYQPAALLADQCLRKGIHILMWLQPWYNAKIELPPGVFAVRATQGRLLVSNHRSHLDAFILLSNVTGVRILAKKPLFYVPFLGLMMRFTKQIPVARGKLDAFFLAMEAVRESLRQGETVHVFPEMTRCPLGAKGTRAFSSAPFLAAIQEWKEVIPLVFVATDTVWPRGKFGLSYRQPVKAFALEPIAPGTYATAEELKTEVQRRISGALA